MRCPKRTLPNLVGLMERHPATRVRLHDLTIQLENEISPPHIDDNVRLLVEVLGVLGQRERLLRVYHRFVAAGFDDTENGVFYWQLARGGYYEDALRSEPRYQRFVLRAIDEYRACPSDNPLSDVGLMLGGAVGSYLLPLAGVGRMADGACLLNLFERVAPGLAASMTSELVEEVCSKQADPSACKETLQRQQAASKECPAWMAATRSEQGEDDSGAGETDVGTTTK